MACSLVEELSAIMPYAEDQAEHKKQQETFFMVLALSSFPNDLENSRQQILASAKCSYIISNPFTDYSIFLIWYHFMFLLSQLSH